MNIGKQAKFAIHKRFGEGREMAFAADEYGNKAFFIRCKAGDFRKKDKD